MPKTSLRKFTFLFILFLFLAFLKGKSAVYAQTLSISKLGVFILGPSDKAPGIIDSGLRIVKVMDPQSNPVLLGYVKEYKNKYPDGIAVLRIYEGTAGRKYGLSDNPEGAAQDFWNGVLSPALAKLGSDKELFDYLSGPNEFDNTPLFNSAESIAWTNRFWLKLAELIANAGFKPLLGEISVGNPEKGDLDGLVPSLRSIKSKGGAWSYHAYTLNYTSSVSDEYYYSLRYRQFYEYFSEKYPDLADLPMILTEAGVDENGGPVTSGWQARGDASKYKNWLMWFDSEIKKDQYILGSAIFQLGDSGWSSFNIEPISSWLASYISGNSFSGEGDASSTQACDKNFWQGLKEKFVGEFGPLVSFLGIGVVPELKKTNLAGLPSGVMDDNKLADCKEDEEANVITEASHNYNIASSRTTPEEAPAKVSLLTKLFSSFSSLFDKGNEEAKEYLAGYLPGGVGEEIIANNTKELSSGDLAQSGDSRVLGLLGKKEEAMKVALGAVQCANLPFGVGDCAESGTLLGSAEISPTGEAASPSIYPGTCPVGTSYCSVSSLRDNLKEIFNLGEKQFSEEVLRQASEICQKESGGVPSAKNDRCLIGKTADYSIGLFQINLLPEGRCPGAFSSYTVNPPSCVIADQDILDKCVEDLFDVQYNIRKAWGIAGYSEGIDPVDWKPNWKPWGAAKYCGIVQ